MAVGLLMNAINVGGNYLCIFHLHMGVEGVAIPTVLSRAVAAVVILALASRPSQTLRIQARNLKSIQPRMMGRILHIGIPSAFENSLFQLGRVVVVSMIASLALTYQTSANAVANNIDSLGVIIGQSMSLAMVTVIGRCVGAQDTDQAMYYLKKLMWLAYLAQGISSALVIVFCGPLVGLYRKLSPEAVELSRQLILVHNGFSILLWPAAFVLPNALRASNDVRFTMVVSIASMIAFRVSLSWVLCVQLGYGALGVWIAMVVDWVCRAGFFVARTLSGKWKTMYHPDAA